MAPEYAMRGQFSIKSDVFSFGVLVLEIVSGQSISNFSAEDDAQSLLSHVSTSVHMLVAIKVVVLLITSHIHE